MARPHAGPAWERWVDLLRLQREIDPHRDEYGNPYSFDPYDFQQIERGRQLMQAGNLDGAAMTFRLARDWGDRARTPDARLVEAEALIYLGDVYRRQGQYDAASQEYQQATKLLETLQARHNLGVALFRYATLCEEMGQIESAREHYCRTRTLWLGLEQENGRRGNWNRMRRYANERGQIEAQIDELLSLIPIVIPRLLPPLPRIEFEIEAIPILETRLAAGAGVWTAGDAVISYVQFDSMLIEGTHYTLTNLLDKSHHVRLLRDYEHAAVRILGNSMEKAGINDQDYVILRKPRGLPYKPENMDIAAVILPDNADRRGILKRFRLEGDVFLLESETSKPDLPEHKTHQYAVPDADRKPPVEFIGRAIAVLKPLS